MNPSVSIIIPTYNRVEVLPRAIDSVLNQTYEKWELLIVDDGSEDNTERLIEEKYSKESRIKFFKRPSKRPKGANACRNIGIEKAEGEYIALLDSDDEWKVSHLESCIKISKEVPSFFGCYSNIILKRGKYTFERRSRKIKSDESFFDFLLGDGYHASAPTYFLKKRYALDIMFDESLKRHQDWDFFLRFGMRYGWSYNNTLNVIVHQNIGTNTLAEDEFESCIKFYRKYEDLISNEEAKGKYLYALYKKALRSNNKKAARFYKNEIVNKGLKSGIALKLPFTYQSYKYLSHKLGVDKLRFFLKHISTNY